MPRRGISSSLVALALAVTLVPAAARGADGLSVWKDGAWRSWWRADEAPAAWNAPNETIAGALAWKPVAPGVEWATARLACAVPTWRSKLIVVRIDPTRVDLSLRFDVSRDGRPDWTVDEAPDEAIVALNAGQFLFGMPWGWVVRDGAQLFAPGRGPLVSAVAIDRAGAVRWGHAGSVPSGDGVETAFQSYPTLLADGAVPAPLRQRGLGVSHTHRDARLAIGETPDHRLLIVLTRFDAMGDVTGALPLGPTTPEMAAILGALGARDAVMLDGGISAQLRLRGDGWTAPERWPGMRKVPLALIARERKAQVSR